jgi:hypothetical protein
MELGDRYSEYEKRSFPRVVVRPPSNVPPPMPRAPAMELGDGYSEYEERSFPPSVPSDNPQTRRPIVAFPKEGVDWSPVFMEGSQGKSVVHAARQTKRDQVALIPVVMVRATSNVPSLVPRAPAMELGDR